MHRSFAASALALAIVALAAPALAQSRDAAGEQVMLDAINARRAAQGLAPLAREASLDAAALVHSVEMADRDVLEHVSEQTGTPADRVHAAGLAISEIAENVAMHHTAAEAQQSLEASDAHLGNMLNPRFTHVGLAAVRDDRGTYVTQVFGRIEPAAPPAVAAPEPPVAPEGTPHIVAPEGAPQVVEVAPQVAGPDASAQSVAPQGGVVAQVAPAGSPTVIVPGHQPGRSVAGYWVCANSRWYYYPLPPGAAPGAQLAPDLSITGPPPGFAPGACSPGASVQATAPAYAPPPAHVPLYGPRLSLPPPPPRIYVPRPRGPRYIIVQPRPGAVVAPYVGGPQLSVEFGIGPHQYGRVRVRRGRR